jgi:SAM-dependent methyltransferase
MNKTQEQWGLVFSHAKHGHIMWDGRATNPYDPTLAYSTAWEFIKFAKEQGFFKEGNKILDIGCGNGRFCIPFSEMKVDYTGIDPMREQIKFCDFAFADYPHLKFVLADIQNDVFNPKGSVPAEQYRFPFPDNYLDDTIAYSVFTHLQTLPVAQNYMKEIKRTLKPGGHFFVTWYRCPPDPVADSNVGRTVYHEWEIMTMMNGFEILISYGGHTGEFYDQWGMFCRKLQK